MELILDNYKHLQRLTKLSPVHRTAFAATCSEGLLSNYSAFAQIENWGDSITLGKSVDYVWSLLLGNNNDLERVQELIHTIYALIPDSNRFPSIYASLARNAAASVIYTLESCLSKDAKYAILVGQASIESIETYLFVVNSPKIIPQIHNPAFDNWIEQAPLMVAEIDKQKQTLTLLESHNLINNSLVNQLRYTAKDIGINLKERGLLGPLLAS